MPDNLTSKVQELIDSDVGDVSRLRHIKRTLENGKTFYNSDRKYLDLLVLKYIDTTYQAVPKSETTKSMTIHKDVLHTKPAEPVGIKENMQNKPVSADAKKENSDSEPSSTETSTLQSAEISEMRKKIDGLEHGLEALSKPKKNLSYGIASGGVFLLVAGLVLLFGGFMLAFVPPSALPDRFQSIDPISGYVAMLIGIVPTLFGVRFIARA